MRTRHLAQGVGVSLLALACGKSDGDHDRSGRPDFRDSGFDSAAGGASGASGAANHGGSAASSGNAGASVGGSGGAFTGGGAGASTGGSAGDASDDPFDAGGTATDAGSAEPDAATEAGTSGLPDGEAPLPDAETPFDAGSEDGSADATADVTPCTGDADDDLVCDELDNCPMHPNPEQLDVDEDGTGYACDSWVELDTDFWDPLSSNWAFSLAARNDSIAISAGPRGVAATWAAVLILEGDALAKELGAALAPYATPRSFVGSDGAGWMTDGASIALRVLGGTVTATYDVGVSLYDAPGGGVFAITSSKVDLWNGAAMTTLFSGASTVSPSFFNQVTYFAYDSGGALTLAAYRSDGTFSILHEGATEIVPIGGVGGQLFCSSNGSSAELMLYDNGVAVAGWPFVLPSTTCADTAQLAVRVGLAQRINDPNGAVWYRTRASGTGYEYLRAQSPQALPESLGASLGKTNEILAPGTHRHGNTVLAGGTSEVLFFDGATFAPVLAEPVVLGSVTRAGRDEVWLWWVDPAVGTVGAPSRVYTGRLDGATFSGAIELPVTGESGHTVTWSELSPAGVLWLNVRHGGPSSTTHGMFSIDAGAASAGMPSGGASATITWDASGKGLLGTSGGVYLVEGTTLTALAAASSPYQRLFGGADDAGFTWITYETAPGTWALARWNDLTFDVVESNLSAAARGVTDDTNTFYVTYGSTAFTFARLSGGTPVPIFANLDVDPLTLRVAGVWVGHTASGVARLSLVKGGIASPPALYADAGMRMFGSSLRASVRDRSGAVRAAICDAKSTNVECTDAGTGELVWRTSTGPDASGARATIATSTATGRAYLWRNVETVAAQDCCAGAAAGTSCGSPSVAACVCAAYETCCTALWDASCALAVESLGCGICGP